MAKQKKKFEKKLKDLQKFENWSDAQYHKVDEKIRKAWEKLVDYYTRVAEWYLVLSRRIRRIRSVDG